MGSEALGLVDQATSSEVVKVLAEVTLTLVLFSDASRIDLATLRDEVSLPARLLGIGLPLTIAAGFAVAVVLFGSFSWTEALLLAIVLAPTDAALGQVVVTLERVPSRVRQSLNVESGLNDGICVPLLLIVLAIEGAETTAESNEAAVRIVVEQIGYGILGGAAAGIVATAIVVYACRDRSWTRPGSRPFRSQVRRWRTGSLPHSVAPGSSPRSQPGWSTAHSRGVVGCLTEYLIEEAGGIFGALTFIIFGAVLLGPALGELTWEIGVYAVLSLTAVRMIPVAIALLGTHARLQTVAFLGWFGPRGLASIVFAILIEESNLLPNEHMLLTTAYATIALSVMCTGSRRPRSRTGTRPGSRRTRRVTEPKLESGEATHQRWRRATPWRHATPRAP